MSESYPLMGIAHEFNVDYGDVLLWAGYLRAMRRPAAERLTYRSARVELALDGYQRIALRMSPTRRKEMVRAMVDHANGRWGEPASTPTGGA
jgi:hypothetical protein